MLQASSTSARRFGLSKCNVKAEPLQNTPLRERRARWFADIYRDLDIPSGWHYRRIHYRMISQDPPLPFHQGGVYQNTMECWSALNTAARDAVALGLIPLDAFVDRRNPSPFTHVEHPIDTRIDGINGEITSIAPVQFFLPVLPRYGELQPGVVPQPYHIELWAEKSTMNDVLVPLALRYNTNLITGIGELSYTACRNLIDRIRGDVERPVRILYISDFDPSGRSMPVAVARKIEFELDRQELDHDVQLRPILLTHNQCVQYRYRAPPSKRLTGVLVGLNSALVKEQPSLTRSKRCTRASLRGS